MTHGFDFTKLVLYGFALALCLLIVLPMSWLVYYGFTDKDGAFTLQNFVTLVNDPTLLDPLVTTFILATQHQPDLLRGRGADGLAGGAHRHAAAPHRARCW